MLTDTHLFASTARADTLTVTNTADDGPGSLRQAIADAQPGDTIDFALAYPATITLTGDVRLQWGSPAIGREHFLGQKRGCLRWHAERDIILHNDDPALGSGEPGARSLRGAGA